MTEELFKLIVEISKRMIESGSEINRVEDCVTRMFTAYGIDNIDVYATTSLIVMSATTADGNDLMQSKRIKQIGTDMERIDKLNSLIRRITAEKCTQYEIAQELERIDKTPVYSTAISVFSYGMIGCVFSLFFGARTVNETVVSFITGCIMGILSYFLCEKNVNKALGRFLCSFCAAVSAFIFLKFNIIPSVNKVIIGNIMSLIPGIGLTNSLRDLFTGDSISGILRSIEAVILALAIAAGYIFAAHLFGGVL